MASGPQLHWCRVWRARAAASGTDDEDSSELRQGRKSKPRSPCRAGPFPSKNGCVVQMAHLCRACVSVGSAYLSAVRLGRMVVRDGG